MTVEWKRIELLMLALDYYENISHIYSWEPFDIMLIYTKQAIGRYIMLQKILFQTKYFSVISCSS